MKNVRTRAFKELFAKLPEQIRRLAKLAFRQFCQDSSHPALHRHRITGTKPPSFSVSITKQYRALYFDDRDTNVWYWIGTHNDYETVIGKK